jgi:hypothetical protein
MMSIDNLRIPSAFAALLAAAAFAAEPARADVCGCAGHPGSLGAFDSANSATWPTIGGRPTTQSSPVLGVRTITMPLPNDGVLVFDSFTLSNAPDGSNATLVFARDRANPPVRLLVAGNFLVGTSDTLSVRGNNGDAGSSTLGNGRGGLGGPGGHKGGDGASPFYSPPQTIGGFGFGPGGGSPSTTANGNRGTYVGPLDLLPLAGGSGGAGGSTTSNGSGIATGGGGGGGGAILVAANGTLRVDGTIDAGGGDRGGPTSSVPSGTGAGGNGSGGGIRLLAERVEGSGTLRALGGQLDTAANGRIRIEAINIALTNAQPSNPVALTAAAPGPLESPLMPQVAITEVGGAAVVEPPIGFAGSLGTVDVIVPAPGAVPVSIETRFVPGGTLVNLKAKPRFGTTTLTVANGFLASATLGDCDASGTCTALAEFTLNPDDYSIEAEATFAVP